MKRKHLIFNCYDLFCDQIIQRFEIIYKNYTLNNSESPVSSTNKTDRQDITEILLKVTLNTISQT
jgi:hypothetical protein